MVNGSVRDSSVSAPLAAEFVERADGSLYELGYSIPVQFIEHVQRAREDLTRGDDRACDQLIGRIYSTVLRVVTRRLRGLPNSDSDATEITHEALLRVSISLDQCRATRDAEAWSWIWAIVSTARVDYLRRELPQLAHRVLQDEVARTLGVASWEDWRDGLDREPSVGDAQLMRALMQAYEALPETTMELILDRVHLGLSLRELANKYGTTPAGIKRRYQRATCTLRRQVIRLVDQGLGAGDGGRELRAALSSRERRRRP